jgi:hypothetical protein
MASTAAPYGLKPVNLIGGTPNAGAMRQVKIASGYGTNIFNGSIVAIASDGTLTVVTTVGSAASPFPAGTLGVFVGCQYTDPSLGYQLQRQNWPTGTVASDAVGFVIDNPGMLFQVQCAGSLSQAALGENVPLNAVQSTSTGSTTTGNSNTAVSATSAVTSGICFRIVDFVSGPTSAVGDAFTDVIVKFNPAAHSYTNGTGI